MRLLAWVGRWGISIGSLLLGFFTLFVFRRGLPHVGWIVGYILLLWLVFALLGAAREALEARGRRLVVRVAEYTIQTLYHNLFLFVLPAYFASATLASPNGSFVALIAAGALLTAVDPWYAALVRPRPWLKHSLLGFSIFAALNVALPLVGVRPLFALLMSAGIAGLGMAPAFRRPGFLGWSRAGVIAAALAVVAMLAVWHGRELVPPAPLFLARAVVARDVRDLEPVETIGDTVSAATLAAWGGIAAYTAVYAPAGIRQTIEHVWHKGDQVIAHVRLSPVRGGRAEGFRTWSRRTDLKAPLPGQYRVDVVTGSGQLIGRLRFTVTP